MMILRIFLLSFFVLVLSQGSVYATYPWNYHDDFYSYSYPSRHSHGQVVSIDLDQKDTASCSLRIAIREDRLEGLEQLIREGADVNSIANDGQTSLMYASRNCSPKAVQFLLRHGAKTNVRDRKGQTPLIFASRGTCIDVVKLLLAAPGTTIESKDYLGMAALDYAQDASLLEVDGPSSKVIDLLLKSKRKVPKRTSSS